MAFVKKTWKNRRAEYINRRLLTNEDGSTNLVTVARDEGTISQEGDAFNAANMNDLEDRIASEFEEIKQSLINENSETFNFGVKDGVRGFFTNPSRADDSFIPFKQKKTYNPDNISYHSCKKNADYTSTYEITIVISFTFLSNVRVGTSILKGFQPPKLETEGFIFGGNNEKYVVGINMNGEIYLKTGSSAGFYTSGYSWTICLGYDPA